MDINYAGLVFSVILIYLSMFVALFSLRSSPDGRFYRNFVTAIIEIYKAKEISVEIKIARVEMIYSQLTLKMSKKYQNNLSSVIQYLIAKSETLNANEFMKRFGIELSPEQKEFLYTINSTIVEKNPFSALTADHAKHLSDLKAAVQSGANDIINSTIIYIKNDIQIAEMQIVEQKKVNTVSIAVSIIGIILSFFFGFQSLLLR